MGSANGVNSTTVQPVVASIPAYLWQVQHAWAGGVPACGGYVGRDWLPTGQTSQLEGEDAALTASPPPTMTAFFLQLLPPPLLLPFPSTLHTCLRKMSVKLNFFLILYLDLKKLNRSPIGTKECSFLFHTAYILF